MAEYDQKLEDIGNKIIFGLEQEWVKGIEENIEDNILHNSLEDYTEDGGCGKINIYTSEAMKKAEEAAQEAVDVINELFGESRTQFDYLDALKYLFLGRN